MIKGTEGTSKNKIKVETKQQLRRKKRKKAYLRGGDDEAIESAMTAESCALIFAVLGLRARRKSE